ncbi:hypothetical protein LL251_07335 [Sphingobium naphthae]|nr:hypothetical protein [Sphingobium naphthae]
MRWLLAAAAILVTGCDQPSQQMPVDRQRVQLHTSDANHATDQRTQRIKAAYVEQRAQMRLSPIAGPDPYRYMSNLQLAADLEGELRALGEPWEFLKEQEDQKDRQFQDDERRRRVDERLMRSGAPDS